MLTDKINFFLRKAQDLNSAALGVEKLRNDNLLKNNLLFTKKPTTSNIEKEFGKINKKLKNYAEGIFGSYADSPIYEEFIDFVLDTYDSIFRKYKISANRVYHYLDEQSRENDEKIDLFILIHDLIHQALQSNFTESLEKQNVHIFADEDDEDYDEEYYIPLLDRIYEDIASSLSNFQPKKSNQGLFEYLKDVFIIEFNKEKQSDDDFPLYVKDKVYLKEMTRRAIENTFKVAKRDLRSKNVSSKIKQFADGFFSKLKHHMLNNISLDNLSDYDIAKSIFKKIDPQSHFEPEYYKRLDEHQVVDDEIDLALREWLMKCNNKANEILNKNYSESEDE